MRRTKIVCTIGPSSEDIDTVKQIITAGMDVARLNFSHGEREEHLRRIETVRQAAREVGKRVAILADTRGPEIRIKRFREGRITLTPGDTFTLTTEDIVGDTQKVAVTYPGLPYDVREGDRILLDDGLIELEVIAVERGLDVRCRVLSGGVLSDRKGINLPGVEVNLPALSEKDEEDIRFSIEEGVDFIAASFVRRTGDILDIRRLVESCGGEARIIAKIENRQGVDNFSEILEIADGIMVARGDLGVEIPVEEVPLVQKIIIERCNRAGKPVITATQMLDSMIRNPRPTRAEASDVANAIFDGTDAVMLSGETALGRNPVEAVRTMARIAERTEQALEYEQILHYFEPAMERNVTDAISFATCHTAQELGVSAIITATESGHTARMVSKYRPRAPIIAVTPHDRVASSLTLTWGVFPLCCPPASNTDEMFSTAVNTALGAKLISHGDMVVITAGIPVGVTGTTNLLRVETVGEVLIQATGIGKKAVTGRVFVARSGADLKDLEEGQVLVVHSTDKEFIPGVEKAGAIVAEEGGLTSHAAILGINLGIPVLVGAEGAREILSPGELVTVDATRGLVYRGRVKIL